MDYSNKRYEKQGIHTIGSIFTVKDGVFKVLLINRKFDPFKGMWALVGGALYNDETVEKSLAREVFEKTGLENIEFSHVGIYSTIDRAPNFRMVALTYMSVIDSDKVAILKKTIHTNNADWFDIKNLPEMAFDHKQIIIDSISFLREHIYDTAILKNLFPKEFTLPDLHKAYESVLETKIDRRNFRKKLLKDGIIVDTGKIYIKSGTKSSKLYSFK